MYSLMSLVHCLKGGKAEGVSITLVGKEGIMTARMGDKETSFTGCIDGNLFNHTIDSRMQSGLPSHTYIKEGQDPGLG